MNNPQEERFTKFNEMEASSVRHHLAANLWNKMDKIAHAEEWLFLKNKEEEGSLLKEAKERENELIQAAKEANEIAKESNSIAVKANLHANTANRRALIAIGLSLCVALIQALIMVKPMNLIKSPNKRRLSEKLFAPSSLQVFRNCRRYAPKNHIAV